MLQWNFFNIKLLEVYTVLVESYIYAILAREGG